MAFLLTLACVHLLAVMTPGPDFLIVTKTAMSSSRRAAAITAFGIVLGVMFWAGLVLLGFHLILLKLAWLQTIIKLAGGAYLLYLAFLMLKSSFQKSEVPLDQQAPREHKTISDGTAFSSGLLTNLANPKAIIYFGSIFATFITASTTTTTKLIMLGLVTVESLAWFLLLGFLFSLPAPRLAYRKANKWIDRVAGTTFGLFGLRLILTSGH